jgi:subtilisin family serine protease
MPNFAIGAARASVDNQALEQAIAFHGAEIGAPVCATGVRVTVLDTGVDPALAPSCTVQYDVTAPAQSVVPQDSEGHGSVVAAIIQKIAPAASISSVKVLPNGTLGALVVGLQLAIAVFEPHVVNLSLGLDVVRTRCKNCGHPNGQQMNEGLIRAYFDSLSHYAGVKPLIVAAAGNDSRLLVPARCDGVVAVGAYSEALQTRPAYSQYPRVPAARFILAEGRDRTSPFGYAGFQNQTALSGTSFSAALVSGVAARLACAYVDHNPCGRLGLPADLDFSSVLLADISRRAVKPPQYDARIHGLGVLRYI